MPGYDSWKTRSPDDDFGSMDDEEPSIEQQRADYEDGMTTEQELMNIADRIRASYPVFADDLERIANNSTLKPLADWSSLPRDLYVISVKSDGIVFDVQCCSVPMAIGPEVRYALTTPD